MSGLPVARSTAGAGDHGAPSRSGLTEPAWLRWSLIGLTVTFLICFLLLPLAVVFYEAFREGARVYFASLVEPYALSAIKLTLTAAVFCLIGNTIFGVAAAWLLTRFRFSGKAFLLSLIDIPFAVSPVIAGLVLVLVFGLHGWAGNKPLAFLWPIAYWLSLGLGTLFLLLTAIRYLRTRRPRWFCIVLALGFPAFAFGVDPVVKNYLAAGHEWQVIFATPGIILATIFVTFPFVARELIPVMQSIGQEEELAAISLGAGGWTTFCRITVPNVKWGLIYGLILCNARAMGEFGAVTVVSGNIRGRTNTMPLHIEVLSNEFQFATSFALSSVLALLAIVTLVIKTILERRLNRPGPEL